MVENLSSALNRKKEFPVLFYVKCEAEHIEKKEIPLRKSK